MHRFLKLVDARPLRKPEMNVRISDENFAKVEAPIKLSLINKPDENIKDENMANKSAAVAQKAVAPVKLSLTKAAIKERRDKNALDTSIFGAPEERIMSPASVQSNEIFMWVEQTFVDGKGDMLDQVEVVVNEIDKLKRVAKREVSVKDDMLEQKDRALKHSMDELIVAAGGEEQYRARIKNLNQKGFNTELKEAKSQATVEHLKEHVDYLKSQVWTSDDLKIETLEKYSALKAVNKRLEDKVCVLEHQLKAQTKPSTQTQSLLLFCVLLVLCCTLLQKMI